jgi:hypothetical protein
VVACLFSASSLRWGNISIVLGAAHNVDPLALVGSADFSRAEYSPRRVVTSVFQVADDFVKPEADVTLDILKENASGSYDPDSL